MYIYITLFYKSVDTPSSVQSKMAIFMTAIRWKVDCFDMKSTPLQFESDIFSRGLNLYVAVPI